MSEMFYYCKKCNKKIDLRSKFCECGRPLAGGIAYTSDEIERMIQENGAVTNAEAEQGQSLTDGEGEMVCPICGKHHGMEYSICDVCGMPLILQPYVQETEEKEIAGEIFELDKYGTVIENPIWKLVTYRFSGEYGEKKHKGRDVVINRNIMSLGRQFLDCSYVFTEEVDPDNSLIGRVSRYNAILYVREGGIFIQYDRTIHTDETVLKKRAPIYINGILLEEEECRALAETDVIKMGNGVADNPELCVEFRVQKIQSNLGAAIDAKEMEKMLESAVNKGMAPLLERQYVMQESLDYAENMQRAILSNTREIKEDTESIKRSINELKNIQIEKYSSIEEYMKAMQGVEHEFRESGIIIKSREEYISDYFSDYGDKTKMLADLNEAQKVYLYYSAFCEYATKTCMGEEADYSAATVYMGKFLENYLYQRVRKMLETYFCRGWQEILKKSVGGDGNKVIGAYTKAINNAYYEKVEKGNDMFSKIARAVRERCPEGSVSRYNIKNAFMNINPVKITRNASAHSTVEAVFANELKKVMYEDYLTAKNNLFGDEGIEILTYCHKVLFEGEQN